MITANCPSCGASVTFESTVALLTVCQHCRSAILRTDLNVADMGKVADLKKDASRLALGVRGTYKGTRFIIIGRVQMAYDGGAWSEWCATFNDGRTGWVSDAMGNYMVSFPSTAPGDLPVADKLHPGDDVTIQGVRYQVRNIDDATYHSIEGEIPSEIPLGETSHLIDLGGPDNRFATLDYGDETPLLFLGEYVPFADLHFENLPEVAR